MGKTSWIALLCDPAIASSRWLLDWLHCRSVAAPVGAFRDTETNQLHWLKNRFRWRNRRDAIVRTVEQRTATATPTQTSVLCGPKPCKHWQTPTSARHGVQQHSQNQVFIYFLDFFWTFKLKKNLVFCHFHRTAWSLKQFAMWLKPETL